MTAVADGTARTARRRTTVPAPAPWLAVGAGVAVALGVLLRLYTPSALWLDESISVSISSLPLGHVQEALRRDGAPPLYALLLWGWERLFGTSPVAVRSLSAVFGLAALPLAALAGHRLGGRSGGTAALLLLATSPFAVYYSTEARMYSLVVLLVLSGFLVLSDYLSEPRRSRGLLVAVLTAALVLTHYWSLFLLAVVAATLLGRAARGGRGTDAQAVAWMAGGAVLFLPWLPSFLFQSRHTGAPWGEPAALSAALSAVASWAGGSTTPGRVLGLLLLLLAVAGAAASAVSGTRLELDLRGRPPGRGLAVVVFGTLLLALVAAQLTGQAFAPRYTSVVFPLFLLLAAVGVGRLPPAGRTGVLVVAVLTGLAGSVGHVVDIGKTQAPVLASALRREALPGDVVLYCPDQLGPAVSRLLPADLHQEVYPTGGSPARVDWVDYEARNRSADPVAFAKRLSREVGAGTIWLVSAPGYRTYEGQCQALTEAFTTLRGAPLSLVESDPLYFERADLAGWAARGRAAR